MKKIGFLSFGHWTDSYSSQVRSASDSLLQSIELPREMVDAEVRAVSAQLLGNDAQLDGLEQRIGRGSHLRAVRVSPMPE